MQGQFENTKLSDNALLELEMEFLFALEEKLKQPSSNSAKLARNFLDIDLPHLPPQEKHTFFLAVADAKNSVFRKYVTAHNSKLRFNASQENNIINQILRNSNLLRPSVVSSNVKEEGVMTLQTIQANITERRKHCLLLATLNSIYQEYRVQGRSKHLAALEQMQKDIQVIFDDTSRSPEKQTSAALKIMENAFKLQVAPNSFFRFLGKHDHKIETVTNSNQEYFYPRLLGMALDKIYSTFPELTNNDISNAVKKISASGMFFNNLESTTPLSQKEILDLFKNPPKLDMRLVTKLWPKLEKKYFLSAAQINFLIVGNSQIVIPQLIAEYKASTNLGKLIANETKAYAEKNSSKSLPADLGIWYTLPKVEAELQKDLIAIKSVIEQIKQRKAELNSPQTRKNR